MAGRPTKQPGQKMALALKIMLTADMDKLLRQAAQLDGVDLSSWARPILLEAARERTAKERKRQK